MSMRDRIDPDSRVPLEELLKVFPGGFNAISNIVERRSTLESVLQTMVADLPPNENVVKEDREIPGLEDGWHAPRKIALSSVTRMAGSLGVAGGAKWGSVTVPLASGNVATGRQYERDGG